jgi:hypothetical protein
MPSLPKRITAVKTKVEASVTFREVLRSTPENRFSNAEKVKIRKVKITRSGSQVVKAVAEAYTPGSSAGTLYDVEIEFKPKKKIKLGCSCDDFVYRFEWVLYNKGSADIQYGNGAPPDDTNPARTLGCCKHVIALRDYLIHKGHIESDA